MDYKITSDNQSMYNTPPCWNIYMCGLFFKYMIQKGGIPYFENLSQQKSQLLYSTIDNSNGFYKCPIDKKCRSRMNIVFVLKNPELES
jgi:phosphoserine aminotransferase